MTKRKIEEENKRRHGWAGWPGVEAEISGLALRLLGVKGMGRGGGVGEFRGFSGEGTGDPGDGRGDRVVTGREGRPRPGHAG